MLKLIVISLLLIIAAIVGYYIGNKLIKNSYPIGTVFGAFFVMLAILSILGVIIYWISYFKQTNLIINMLIWASHHVLGITLIMLGITLVGFMIALLIQTNFMANVALGLLITYGIFILIMELYVMLKLGLVDVVSYIKYIINHAPALAYAKPIIIDVITLIILKFPIKINRMFNNEKERALIKKTFFTKKKKKG